MIAKAANMLRHHLCNFWLGYQNPEKGSGLGTIALKYKENESFYPSGTKVCVEKTFRDVSPATDP